jgi:CYTH domain-containing protein
MCYKQKVKGRVIEIQKKISRRDFEDLWSVSMGKLEKVRYNLVYGSAIWEVDFFKDDSETYFALAEIEMPESQLKPDFIPGIITSNLIYEVARSDDRFASKRLADVNYARKLYLKIVEENHV